MATPRFQTDLEMRDYAYTEGEKPYVLTAPLVYRTDILPQGTIEVPAGYQTDFASVPRIFWRLFPPGGSYRAAAVVHDWLCDVEPKICSSKEAALVFLEAMEELQIGWLTRKLMYRAVRVGGPRFKRG